MRINSKLINTALNNNKIKILELLWNLSTVYMSCSYLKLIVTA